MNGGPFGEGYAPQYDRLYADKDYAAECDLIEEVFQRYGGQPITSILDLGCGTGGHAFPLAARGYRVTGVDVSPAMLREAERKLAGHTRDSVPEFVLGDIRELELDRQFDAALMMFAVLGYQASDADLQLALQSVRRHLRPGGLFVGDFWYGPTVLRVAPSDRIKQVDLDGQQLVRSATTTLDLGRHQA
ncbi:MAG: class I SAM-dependent DNA methyltransferase, partial [Anaerolineales bacterium]